MVGRSLACESYGDRCPGSPNTSLLNSIDHVQYLMQFVQQNKGFARRIIIVIISLF